MIKRINEAHQEYYVSSEGLVFNSYKNVVKQFDNGKGYKYVVFRYGGKVKHEYVHRLVATAFLPRKNGCSEVNHLDGNKSNNSVSNLEWCTRNRNVQHAYDYGLAPQGTKKWNSKFSDSDLLLIFELREQGLLQREIALQLGVCQSTISAVLRGRYYREADLISLGVMTRKRMNEIDGGIV